MAMRIAGHHKSPVPDFSRINGRRYPCGRQPVRSWGLLWTPSPVSRRMSGAARPEFNRSSFAAILCVEDDTPHGCGLTHGRQDRFSCVVVRSAHFPTHTPSLLSQLLQSWTSVIKAVAGLPRNAGTADTHLDSVFSTLKVCVQVRILRAAANRTSLPEASVDPILRASILCNFVPDLRLLVCRLSSYMYELTASLFTSWPYERHRRMRRSRLDSLRHEPPTVTCCFLITTPSLKDGRMAVSRRRGKEVWFPLPQRCTVHKCSLTCACSSHAHVKGCMLLLCGD
ncbi:hypothetical protein TcYC6_0036720 [Trypanosoma cruzi]|nr:hypothetical protein TcYC6_0036720 [Trypanosoma cruzi]